ncbi:DNA gyrase inhibitor YacG [Phenylobacterium immobile]|uniref:DNA gyrase inhibitor YacG n=1 Tax=Phenylobacterium immobile TaxID=21 RepID=UPI000A8C1E82|nr:DNA gyrase inhibitor YacG [Phenylobacterium immobile]
MTCPICKRPAQDAYKPFCSKRCSDVDLQRWLTNRYAVPGETEDLADDEVD